MTTDLEARLRRGLATMASTTQVDPAALERIVERSVDRPAPHRRWRPVLAVAAVVTLVVGAVVLLRSPDDAQQVVADLPAAPPAISGTATAHFHPTTPCSGACDVARFAVRSPSELTPILTGDWIRVEVLADGRYVTAAVAATGRAPGPEVLTDPSGGAPLPLGNGDVFSVTPRADGRLVMLARVDDRFVLRHVDPRTGAVSDRKLPSGRALALTEGPDRSVAVLLDSDRSGTHRPRPRLLVIDSRGKESTRGLPSALAERLEQAATRLNDSTMSWSRTGLLAISDVRPNANLLFENARYAWTVVVDPSTGKLVRLLRGWQGVAWSPDGRGLLLAHPADRPGNSDLAVFWGPGLKERIDIGSAPNPLAPFHWSP